MTRQLSPRDRLIFALDVNDPINALRFVELLSDYVGLFKIGLEVIFSIFRDVVCGENIDPWHRVLSAARGKLFVDGKLHDIPNTVVGALLSILDAGVVMTNLHATGGQKMIAEAIKIRDNWSRENPGKTVPILAAVTVLTSLGYDDMVSLGWLSPLPTGLTKEKQEALKAMRIRDSVSRLASLADGFGYDGIICSALEIKVVREVVGPEVALITPGIRPEWSVVGDQKRITTPRQAIATGADYIVVGRPISEPPDELTPRDAAMMIENEIAQGLFDRQD